MCLSGMGEYRELPRSFLGMAVRFRVENWENGTGGRGSAGDWTYQLELGLARTSQRVARRKMVAGVVLPLLRSNDHNDLWSTGSAHSMWEFRCNVAAQWSS
jgi:hypothetical protein